MLRWPLAAFTITNESDIAARRAALRERLAYQHQVMQECEAWHTLDLERLKPVIWRNEEENVKRHTVASLVPQSVKNTCVAFTASRQPKITAVPKDILAAPSLRNANQTERFEYALWHQINKMRQYALTADTSEYAYGRAVMIGKVSWLTPEQRGDTRQAQPVPTIEETAADFFAPEPVDDPMMLYKTVEQGEFPLLVQLYDPLDCLWSIGRDGRTREFIHVSRLSWDDVVDLYPDIIEMEPFRSRNTVLSMTAPVDVVDYWDETHNAILVDGRFYKKPTEHEYPCCPIIIQVANPQQVRQGNGSGAERQMVSIPITWPILTAAADASHMLSITATYLEYGVFQTYVHEHIDPENSPYFQAIGDAQEPTYNNIVDIRPGAVFPTFGNERLRPLEQSRLNEQMAWYTDQMSSQMAMSGFHPNFLTGITPAGPDSGYGIVQQRIATTAKMTVFTIAIDRFLSRLMTLAKDIIAAEWDFEPDAQMMLAAMVGRAGHEVEGQLPFGRDAFDAVREIQVQVIPEVPLNDEQEQSAIFQANSQGLMSDYRAIDRLPWADDPEEEQKRIAAEQVVKTDPLFGPPIRLAMAADWMRQNGMTAEAENIAKAAQAMSQQALSQLMPQPATPPTSPSPLPGGAGGMTPPPAPGGMPLDPAALGMPVDPTMMQGMDPAMMGAPMPPVDPSMMQGGVPPEMAMMGAGDPANAPPVDPAMLAMLLQRGGR